jgi:hypothetical protein
MVGALPVHEMEATCIRLEQMALGVMLKYVITGTLAAEELHN